MDSRVNEVITSALENSGMPQGTLNLMERTFAERNRSQGRGGGLAQTTAGLGMRDASLQSIQAFTQLGAGRVDAATNRSIGIGQQALGQAMQIQDTDIMRKQATAQSRANIEAAGDPFAQLKIQLETTQAGLNSQVANLTLGQQLSNLYPTPQMNGGASGPSGMQQAGAGLMAGGGALMSSGLVAAGPIGLGVMAGGALISALG